MTRIERQAAALDHARYLSGRHDTTAWVYPIQQPSGQIDYWTRFTDHADTEIDGLDVRPIAGFRGGQPIELETPAADDLSVPVTFPGVAQAQALLSGPMNAVWQALNGLDNESLGRLIRFARQIDDNRARASR